MNGKQYIGEELEYWKEQDFLRNRSLNHKRLITCNDRQIDGASHHNGQLTSERTSLGRNGADADDDGGVIMMACRLDLHLLTMQ